MASCHILRTAVATKVFKQLNFYDVPSENVAICTGEGTIAFNMSKNTKKPTYDSRDPVLT